MATDAIKEKVAIGATEPKTAYISIDNSAHTICQRCLLCDSTRPFVNGYPPGPSPWVCDECLEAIAFVKALRNSAKEVSEEDSKEIEASIALL